jgi:molybdopterin-binding protein
MKLSARNQLNATVETVVHGEVMSTVRSPARRSARHAAITKGTAEELALRPVTR